MAFFQPLVSLEMLKRQIKGKDIATGQEDINSYRSVGTAKSIYREGNSTVVFHKLGPHPTYNTTTNRPNPPRSSHGKRRK